MSDIDNTLSDEEFRKKYISDKLSEDEKMKLYESVINNDLETFKSYINGTPERAPYDIFEEISKKDYGWTAFHYAMHYGKKKLIEFIIEYLQSQNKLSIALRLKSNDGRCPLLCLLKSNALEKNDKLDIFNEICSKYSLPINDAVQQRLEAMNKNQNDVKPDPSKPNPYPDHPLITNLLTINEKMKFYEAAVKNNVELFKSLIYNSDNGTIYSIFEEVSAKEYYWTVFHYAMHYACWDIIKFIFEYLYSKNLVDEALNMKTSDLRCPLLCLLKSDAINSDVKRETFKKIVTTFPIHVNGDVINELLDRKMDDLIYFINAN